MKPLFVSTLVALLIASLALRLSQPDTSSDRPVIYWITDKNPARLEQVESFHRWLVDEGHTAADGGPACRLRLDTSNTEMTKKVIQSVSGVGSDVMDLFGGANMRLMASMGVLEPLDGPAERLGFSLEDTYPQLASELSTGGRQYMFPCNVSARALIVNPAAFEAAGQPLPPRRWTVEEFERAGKAFVAAANPPGTPPAERKFFLDQIPINLLWRSFGASSLNETGTASGFDADGYRRALALQQKWIYEDRILPTPDDVSAFATAQGYGGASLQLFGRGTYAMVTGGRFFLIQLRNFRNLTRLTVAESPHGGFPNTDVRVRGASVYAGGDAQPYAHLFLAFLASDRYGSLIVRDADALPPNPRALETEAFLRPPDHPAEWGFHGPFAEIALSTGVGGSYSPFIQTTELGRERVAFQELHLTGRLSLEEAVARTHASINRRIRSTVQRKPDLQPEYRRRLAIQRAIDRRREAGEPIPENWVFNAFFEAYHRRAGRLGPAEPFPSPDGAEGPAAASPPAASASLHLRATGNERPDRGA